MPGIYITALLTTGLALGFYGFLLRRLPGEVDRRWLLWAVLMTLPMEPFSFYCLRLPLIHLLKTQAATLHHWLTPWYAPLTEEPAKLTPLVWPALANQIKRENVARFAIAIGLGFGIGELWMLAHLVAADPSQGSQPWYQYGGFVGERLMVCLNHAAFVGLALFGLTRGRFLAGEAAAMLAHFGGNLPLFLRGSLPAVSDMVWTQLLVLWLVLYLVAGAFWLSWLAAGRLALGELLYGHARCPGCQKVYPRSLWAVNAGVSRYERCPHCRSWHWIRTKDEIDPQESPGRDSLSGQET